MPTVRCQPLNTAQRCCTQLCLAQHLCWVQRDHQLLVFKGCWSELADRKHHTSFMELLRKTPDAAKENSRSSNSSQLELFTGARDGRNTAHQSHFCSDGNGLVPIYSSKRVYFSPLAMKRSTGDWAVRIRCECLCCLYESYLKV